MKNVFLAISIILTLVAIIPYIRDILRGKTKPNIVSWLTWSILTGIATAAAWSGGEKVAAIFTGVATLETLLVVVLGIKFGKFKYTQFDIVCQVAALVGIVIWQLFDSPAIGVLAAVIVDFIGGLPTFRHAWIKPFEETWQTFALAAASSVFAILALETFNWVNLPFMIYLLAANSLLVVFVLVRRPQLQRPIIRL